MKIVINKCFGGFRLSDKAIDRLKELGYEPPEGCSTIEEELIPEKDIFSRAHKYWGLQDIPRDHPLLIQVVEELEDKADRNLAKLKVVEIPDDVNWAIEEYDGTEWIREVSREWR